MLPCTGESPSRQYLSSDSRSLRRYRSRRLLGLCAGSFVGAPVSPVTAGRCKTSLGTLEYSVRGTGEPILAIHGAGGGFDQAIDMTGALAQYQYRLIAPSRFGYLRSSLPADLSVALESKCR
jgi:pimeloyl-ACP methyl ester carboxylesterase